MKIINDLKFHDPIYTSSHKQKTPRMWGFLFNNISLRTITRILFSHIIFNTRWIWGTELVVVDGERPRRTPIDIQITEAFWYLSVELIIS
jgi:hypothetical protein